MTDGRHRMALSDEHPTTTNVRFLLRGNGMPRSCVLVLAGLVLNVAFAGFANPVFARLVPGTGQRMTNVGDDFEDEKWQYYPNLPKASSNIDKTTRAPSGGSANGRWLESLFRGTPDSCTRVITPQGGLPNSKGAMAMRTLQSGIPGRISNEFQQDDLIANCSGPLGGPIPVGWSPSVVTRVFLPPFEFWEKRSGSHFGFRIDCQTIIEKPGKGGGLFRKVTTSKVQEPYWPGFFVQFNSKADGRNQTDSAHLLIRSGSRGEDIPGPRITEPGWWTLGISVTPDGQVHYYGHAGVADLTEKDHLYSSFPYSYKAQTMSTFFFNVVNQDDGRSWSTEWIVDDTFLYVVK